MGLPPLIARVLPGCILLAGCTGGGDNLAGDFVLGIEREGAQVVVIRNTSRTLLSEQPSAVGDALEAVGGRTGSFLIEDDRVTELTPVNNTESVPIAAILQ